jgi:hypothetical protein
VAVSSDGPQSALPLGECSGRRSLFSIPVTILEHFCYLTRKSSIYGGIVYISSSLHSIAFTTFAERSLFFGMNASDPPEMGYCLTVMDNVNSTL